MWIPPGPFDTFCKGFGIPGDSWVFSTTLSFIHFTYVLANHSVGIPRDSPVFYDPWGLYFLRACVFFWCSWVSWKSLAPCFLYFSCFLYTKVVWPEKTWFCFCWCLPSASSFWRQKIGQQRVKLRKKHIEIKSDFDIWSELPISPVLIKLLQVFFLGAQGHMGHVLNNIVFMLSKGPLERARRKKNCVARKPA